MPELRAFLASQRPHRHEWTVLRSREHELEWCPPCGAVRPKPADETDD